MRPPDQAKAVREAALEAGYKALYAKRLTEARRHMLEAQQAKAPAAEVARLGRLIKIAEDSRAKTRNNSGFLGFIFVGFCYLIFAMQQPLTWGVGFWWAMCFLVTPTCTGLIVRKLQGPDSEPRKRFFASFHAVFWAMFFYCGATLCVHRMRIETGGSSGEILLVGLVSTVAYSLVAGLVAGLSGGMTIAPKVEEAQTNE